MWYPTSTAGPWFGSPAKPLTILPSSNVDSITGLLTNCRILKNVKKFSISSVSGNRVTHFVGISQKFFAFQTQPGRKLY
jgi:hypothetical protein